MAIQVSAPGRICLFGEHQDFLKLAVIASPINLDIKITGTPRTDTQFVLHMPDLTGREPDFDQFDGAVELEYRNKRDYLRSVTNVLRRAGLKITTGYDCEINGNIPINAGTSSSSALTIAWIKFLLHTQPGDVAATPEDIAVWGYTCEVREFNEPGGMMDHFASAVGGLLHIDCQEPFKCTKLPAKLDGFVLGESGIPKNTVDVLGDSRRATNAGMAILQEKIPNFCLRECGWEIAESFVKQMDASVAKRIKANFINRDLCNDAFKMLNSGVVDEKRLGQMLYEHQVQLRDGIGVSHPKLDALIDAAMEAGALGGKLNGSGGGGAMFAYAPGRQHEVAEAINRAGGKAHILTLRDGVSVCEV